jgi:hypothetical protein
MQYSSSTQKLKRKTEKKEEAINQNQKGREGNRTE